MYRKFALACILFIVAFFVGNLVCWHFVTAPTFFSAKGHGDLQRLGYLQPVDLPMGQETDGSNYVEFPDYLKAGANGHFDIITIGDSFSNHGGASHYQDFLATATGWSILHVPNYNFDAVSMYYILDELGYIDQIKPRYVILESVERSVQSRYGNTMLTTPKMDDSSFRKLMSKPMYQQSAQRGQWAPGIMVKANLKLIANKLRFGSHPYRLSQEVDHAMLQRPAFSATGHEQELIFYHDDLQYLVKPLQAEKVNENLNHAAADMRRKGIQLVFFIAPDKFDVYYPLLDEEVQARWPENPTFARMREMDHDYIFIDVLPLFREAIIHGEQDFYWYDDTHWSWKAQKLFCAELVRQLR